MNKVEIINDMVNLRDYHLREAEKITKAIELMQDEIVGAKVDMEVVDYDFPDYPMTSAIIEKYKYLSQRIGKIWTLKHVNSLIEGKERMLAENTLKNATQLVHYYVKTKHLIRVRFISQKNKKHTFFTTQKDWFEKTAEDTFMLRKEYMPDDSALVGLNDSEKHNPEIIGLL